MQHYFLKLNPPRKSFMKDMTEDERKIMQKHVAYWAYKWHPMTAVTNQN
jgi:hypothetical protein